MLSGYRIMWMIVLFDLPVMERSQRKAAATFRHHLLDLGFSMAQYSVYMRVCASKEIFSSYVNQVRHALPPEGHVQIIGITDRQYENILAFSSATQDRGREKPAQYVLF